MPEAIIDNNPRPDLSPKVDQILWSDEEADVVIKFVNGDFVQKPLSPEEENRLWGKIKKGNEFEEKDIKSLLEKAKFLREKYKYLESKFQELPLELDNLSEDEYKYLSKLAATTVLRIVEPLLRKNNIWDTNTSTRTQASHGLRNKSNFSEDELTEIPELEKSGFYLPSEGGPDVIGIIRTPVFEKIQNPNEARFRKGLAHEIAHFIRALANKKLWEKFIEKAQQSGLRSADPKEKLGRVKVIGGFYVGSNQQGSESVGELFSITAALRKVDEKPTVDDVLKVLYPNLDIDPSKVEASRSRYHVARVALFDHLGQLSDMGYGGMPIVNLLALGTIGYVSFEKLPQLIKLGVIDWDKYTKMRSVAMGVLDWLSGDKETISI